MPWGNIQNRSKLVQDLRLHKLSRAELVPLWFVVLLGRSFQFFRECNFILRVAKRNPQDSSFILDESMTNWSVHTRFLVNLVESVKHNEDQLPFSLASHIRHVRFPPEDLWSFFKEVSSCGNPLHPGHMLLVCGRLFDVYDPSLFTADH